MVIKAFADEAGTHDKTGQHAGAAVPVVAGYYAPVEQWAVFCRDWQRVLDDYRAPYFHHKEFGFHQRLKPKNRFRDWTDKKIRAFYYALAMVAASGPVPIGGMCWAQEHHNRGMTGDPHEIAMKMFFNGFCEAVNIKTLKNVEKVLFVFDDNEKKEWVQTLWEVYSLFKQRNPDFGGLVFADDKDQLPLQAADLYAAASHKRGLDFMVGNKQYMKPRIIDLILTRCSPKEDPENRLLENMPDPAFRMMMELFIEDEERQQREWKKKGLKQDYLPEQHFPFEKWKQNNQKLLLKNFGNLRKK